MIAPLSRLHVALQLDPLNRQHDLPQKWIGKFMSAKFAFRAHVSTREPNIETERIGMRDRQKRVREKVRAQAEKQVEAED